MDSKLLALAFLSSVIVLTAATALKENDENLIILAETSSNHTAKQIVSDKPVVIHTQLQHYDQPTLKEYQECHENLEKCRKVCEGVGNPIACVKECPVCPFLVKEKIVVQGINDTDLAPRAVDSLNTTNIIRLTNEIRNIIESHQGNITYRNENIVHVHQNISKIGGKFGLGYNNTDPCCIIVRSSRQCEMQQFSSASRCHQKRHRGCGKQCKARVMLAKRITVCERNQSNEDYSEENCHETVTYDPYTSRRRHHKETQNKCSSIPTWPYVLCGQNQEEYEHSICRRCLNLPYHYILQRGIPGQCSRCFMKYSRPNFEIFMPSWHPPVNSNFDFLYDNNDFDSNINGWQRDKIKCRLPDGTITENCYNDSDSAAANTWHDVPEEQDVYDYDDEAGSDIDFKENPRKRRHTFKRSKYSHRHS